MLKTASGTGIVVAKLSIWSALVELAYSSSQLRSQVIVGLDQNL